MHNKIMGQTRTGFTTVCALSLSAVLFATHCLVIMIICAKLVSNPTMHNKVMGRTRTGFTEVYAQSLDANCDLDLGPSDMVCLRYIVLS